MELAAVDSAQAAAFKEWWAKQVEERRTFFKSAHSGKEKRAYMKELKSQREGFLSLQSDELTRRKTEQKARLEAERDAQALQLKEFREFLNRGEVPPEKLWPEGRH